MRRFDLVTIGRQFGAGGSDLAAVLAETLGWPVLDREIIHGAASRLHAEAAQAATLDEVVTSAFQKLAKGFALAVPEYAIEPAYELDADDVARATHDVLRKAAESAPLVVVGHGGQCVFASRPGTLRVRVVAPAAVRAERVAARLGVDVDEATRQVASRDTQRARYLRHHFGCDNNDPTLYDVQLNTAHLSIAQVAHAVSGIVQG